ncbi:MAG: hypothetical protein R3248_07940 [Candidatus Promineifilaceae bacterium]|nr:hypothetical protein [Candidatus Promineifilaceae bacterium]
MSDNGEFEQLVERLSRWDRRRRWRDALLWLPRGLLAGLLLAALVAAAARVRPLLTNEEVGYVAAGLALAGLVAAAGVLFTRRRTLLEKARFADRHFGLQERASTTVELNAGRLQAPPFLAGQQMADTVRATSAVDAKAGLPLRANRQDWLVIGLTLLLLIAAVWLPNPRAEVLQHRREVAKTIAEQTEALETISEEIEENEALTEEQRDALQEPVESALQELQAEDLTQEEAVAVLSEAEAELRDLSAANSIESLRRQLESAGRPLVENAASQSLGRALQSGNLAQAGAAAAQLADDLSALDEQEAADLAESLAETASALEGADGELSQSLQEAADALREGDVAAAQEALREASGALQQRAQQQAAERQAAEAAGQLNEGRREVAQAGQEGGQAGEGEQAAGEGQGEGQGPGGSQGQGQGQGQVDGAGAGQGNSGEGTGTGASAGGIGGESGHAESVYVPDFADLSGEAGEDVELPAECIANPESCGALLNETPTEFGDETSTVPYSQVFGDYRDAAYEALNDDYIPLGMKEYVRDYFSSLEP